MALKKEIVLKNGIKTEDILDKIEDMPDIEDECE